MSSNLTHVVVAVCAFLALAVWARDDVGWTPSVAFLLAVYAALVLVLCLGLHSMAVRLHRTQQQAMLLALRLQQQQQQQVQSAAS